MEIKFPRQLWRCSVYFFLLLATPAVGEPLSHPAVWSPPVIGTTETKGVVQAGRPEKAKPVIHPSQHYKWEAIPGTTYRGYEHSGIQRKFFITPNNCLLFGKDVDGVTICSTSKKKKLKCHDASKVSSCVTQPTIQPPVVPVVISVPTPRPTPTPVRKIRPSPSPTPRPMATRPDKNYFTTGWVAAGESDHLVGGLWDVAQKIRVSGIDVRDFLAFGDGRRPLYFLFDAYADKFSMPGVAGSLPLYRHSVMAAVYAELTPGASEDPFSGGGSVKLGGGLSDERLPFLSLSPLAVGGGMLDSREALGFFAGVSAARGLYPTAYLGLDVDLVARLLTPTLSGYKTDAHAFLRQRVGDAAFIEVGGGSRSSALRSNGSDACGGMPACRQPAYIESALFTEFAYGVQF